jgi:hypothetical protein
LLDSTMFLHNGSALGTVHDPEGASEGSESSSTASGTASGTATAARANGPTATRQDARSRQFWHAFGQPLGLTVAARSDGTVSAPKHDDVKADDEEEERRRQRLCEELAARGHAAWEGWAASVVGEEARLGAYATAIDALESNGLHPAFLLLFDQPWESIQRVASYAKTVLGNKLALQYAADVVHVRPGDEGLPMKRGLVGGDTVSSQGCAAFFDADGVGDGGGRLTLPRAATLSIALTDASPETSCTYVIPSAVDPQYRGQHTQTASDDAEAGGSGDGSLTEIAAKHHQHMTALPIPRGGLLALSHRIIRWESAHASKSLPEAAAAAARAEGRKTLTFLIADPDYSPRLLSSGGDDDGATPSFDSRLALVAASLVAQHHTAAIPPHLLSLILGVLAAGSCVHLSEAALADTWPFGARFQGNLASIQDALVGVSAALTAQTTQAAAATQEAMASPPASPHVPAGAPAQVAAAQRATEQQLDATGLIARHIIDTRCLAASAAIERIARSPRVSASGATSTSAAAVASSPQESGLGDAGRLPKSAAVATPPPAATTTAAPLAAAEPTTRFVEVD